MTKVVVHIAPNSGTPIYLQIVQQLRYQIASGRLTPGDDLPTIRAFAEQLLTNPNTVGRAYRELEQEGLVVSRVGSGTRVSDRGSPLALEERRRILSDYADSLLAVAGQLKFSLDEAIEMLKARYARMGTYEQGAPASLPTSLQIETPAEMPALPTHGENSHE
jgi:GntR family transcriptional regulator